MDFPEFFEGLSDKQRARLARVADTSVEYIEAHLLAGRRLPRVALLKALTAAANELGGRYTKEELMACFLKAQEQRASA